ncbi:MAG: VOC family protein [Gemmatimonadales bacterium]|nr:VOC family protein [Gemmatimonadales bacterium]
MSRRPAVSRLALLLLCLAVLPLAAFVPSEAALSPRFNHVMLYVGDLDASIAFYTAAFDARVAQRLTQLTVTGPDGQTVTRDVRMALLRFPGQEFVLELAERKAATDVAPPFYQHLGVDVRDIGAALARAKAAGARTPTGISTVRAGDVVAKNAFFKGPDGELLELMEVVKGEF